MFYVDELLFIVRCVVVDAVIVSSSNSIDRQPPAVFWILDLPIVCLPGWFGFILPMIDVIQYQSEVESQQVDIQRIFLLLLPSF